MRKTIVAAITILLLVVTTAVACEGDKLSTYVGIAVDRCFARNATLTFDTPGGKRMFITLSAEDAKRLRDALNRSYPK